MYKYDLLEDEDLQLTPPEGTVDVTVKPSKLLDGTALRLQADVEEDGPVTTTTETLPAAAAAEPAAIPKPAMHSKSFTQKQFDDTVKRVQEGGVASTTEEAMKPGTYNAAPDWYEGGKPPAHSWAKDLMGVLGSRLAAPSQVAMQDPRRPLDQKMRDAKRVALASGLTSLMGRAFDKPAIDYDRNLDAATKEAGMTHRLTGGKSAAQQKYENDLNMLKVMQNERATDSLVGKREHDTAAYDAEHDPNNPQAVALRKLLTDKLGGGNFDGLGLDALKRAATAAGISFSQDQANARQEIGIRAGERKDATAANTREEERVRKDQQDELYRQNQANVDGVTWTKGVPSTQTVEKVRKSKTARDQLLQNLDKMSEIQRKLNEKGKGWRGEIDKFLPHDKEAQQLVADAKAIRDQLLVQRREMANLGVPALWEQQMVSTLIPEAGSPKAWIMGEPAWTGLRKAVDDDFNVFLKDHGGNLTGYSQPTEASKIAPVKKTVPPAKKIEQGKVVEQPDLPDVPAVAPGDTLPVTGSVAPGPAKIPQSSVQLPEVQVSSRPPKPAEAPAANKQWYLVNGAWKQISPQAVEALKSSRPDWVIEQ